MLILYAPSISAVKSDLWKETALIEKMKWKAQNDPRLEVQSLWNWLLEYVLCRLQFHLSGDNSLRDFTHGYSGDEVCTGPQDIMDLAKGEMRSKVFWMSGFAPAWKRRQLDWELAHSSLGRVLFLKAIEAAAVVTLKSQEASITFRALQFLIK
jgi:hypothetical protein